MSEVNFSPAETLCPTNITQGISAHPAAYFPEINCYWKNTVHLERSKCFPNLQKSQESEPSNYRPISLTCVLRKILEHSVASSLAKHFTELDIFDEMQHGFWEKRSCETQLIRNWWTIWKHADWQADWSNSFVKLLIKLPMKKFSLNYTIMVSEETLLNG